MSKRQRRSDVSSDVHRARGENAAIRSKRAELHQRHLINQRLHKAARAGAASVVANRKAADLPKPPSEHEVKRSTLRDALRYVAQEMERAMENEEVNRNVSGRHG
jgi:hypothetical protein